MDFFIKCFAFVVPWKTVGRYKGYCKRDRGGFLAGRDMRADRVPPLNAFWACTAAALYDKKIVSGTILGGTLMLK